MVKLYLAEGHKPILVEGKKIRGICIHPIATHHPNEWPTIRVYVEKYLKEAAPSLVGKPLRLDHGNLLIGSKVTKAWWNVDKSGVEYEAEVTDDVARMIREGQIHGVSVGVDFNAPASGLVMTEQGAIPYSFSFEELSLLQTMQPGDPAASVELWAEGIANAIGLPKNEPPKPQKPENLNLTPFEQWKRRHRNV